MLLDWRCASTTRRPHRAHEVPDQAAPGFELRRRGAVAAVGLALPPAALMFGKLPANSTATLLLLKPCEAQQQRRDRMQLQDLALWQDREVRLGAQVTVQRIAAPEATRHLVQHQRVHALRIALAFAQAAVGLRGQVDDLAVGCGAGAAFIFVLVLVLELVLEFARCVGCVRRRVGWGCGRNPANRQCCRRHRPPRVPAPARVRASALARDRGSDTPAGSASDRRRCATGRLDHHRRGIAGPVGRPGWRQRKRPWAWAGPRTGRRSAVAPGWRAAAAVPVVRVVLAVRRVPTRRGAAARAPAKRRRRGRVLRSRLGFVELGRTGRERLPEPFMSTP